MKAFLLLFGFLFLSSIIAAYKIKGNENDTAKKELGHFLFFDKDLSWERDRSCASCHDPLMAFTDGYRVSLNGKAEPMLRNSPTLLNLNHRNFFSWSDPEVKTLAMQMQRPLFSQHPVEMGLKGKELEIIARLSKKKVYRKLYREAFGRTIAEWNFGELVDCIVLYELGLQSRDSRYDKFSVSHDPSILTDEEKNGMLLFFSDSLFCGECHGGIDFFENQRGFDMANVGLYNCEGSYPLTDLGLQRHTGLEEDNGFFRIPTLRNIAITAPYYHDGSEFSLEQVIKNYERGGRIFTGTLCNGDGALHPGLDGRITPFTITEKERKDLIHFLNALTDTSYLSKYYFNDPFNWNN